MAVPLPAADESDAAAGMPDDTRRLLSYLSGGHTDGSIARERTVSRRTARLQEVMGVRTRFQLGVQASRRGWL